MNKKIGFEIVIFYFLLSISEIQYSILKIGPTLVDIKHTCMEF